MTGAQRQSTPKEPQAARARPDTPQTGPAANEDGGADTRKPADKSVSASADSRQGAPAPLSAAAAQSPIAGLLAGANAGQQAQGSLSRSEQTAGSVRDGAVRSANETRKPLTAVAPARPERPVHEFARLLARRLDSGGSEFELRLDPPHLGRVDARLAVGDDGKALVALKFDNPAALDLFSRDEAQLRAALFSAGFDAGGADISFSLREEAGRSELEAPRPSAGLPIASEHAFLAPIASGVLDISA